MEARHLDGGLFFAYGLAQSQLTTSIFGPHSSPGVLAIGAFVFFGVALRKRKFDFSAIFHVALPLAVAAFLFVPVVGNFNQTFTALCIAAAYTACSILLVRDESDEHVLPPGHFGFVALLHRTQHKNDIQCSWPRSTRSHSGIVNRNRQLVHPIDRRSDSRNRQQHHPADGAKHYRAMGHRDQNL